MSYKFVNERDVTTITVEVNSNDVTWMELLECFYEFCMAAGYSIRREDFGLDDCFSGTEENECSTVLKGDE